MRIYTDEEERAVRLRAAVRDWARSGLIARDQAAQLEADVPLGLRRTGLMLRLGLALFTALVAGAGVALLYTLLGIRSEGPGAAVAAFAALIGFAAANALVTGGRLYRYGVEEVLAAASVVLLAVSAALAVEIAFGGRHVTAVTTTALGAGAVGAAFVYRRFGLQYAAVVAMVCVAEIPPQFSFSRPAQTLLSAAVFALAFWWARRLHARHGDEFPGDEGANLQAAAFLGVYLTLNLMVTPAIPFASPVAPIEPWFRWLTYGLTWILPAIVLLLAIRAKDRTLLGASLIAALVTLVTSKPYLGWPRHAWDPMLFGALLVSVAIATRRWLAAGPGGERSGFTPLRTLASDADAIRLVAVASVQMHPTPVAPATADASGFAGGRSGGGGGGADF